MKVEITQAAEHDLAEIAAHIAKDSATRAYSFASELESEVWAIGNNPEAYQFVPGYEDRGVRRKVHGRYLIFFRIEAKRVTILHILHGARDYPSLLFPGD